MPAAITKVQKRPSVLSKVLLLSLTNSRFEIIRRRKKLIAPNRREIRRDFFSNLHLPKLLLINDKVKGSLSSIVGFLENSKSQIDLEHKLVVRNIAVWAQI